MRQNRRKSGTAIETQKVLREEWIPLYRMPVGAFEVAAGGSGKKRGI